jgi:glycine cleavage system H lipoate-binding protein
VYTPVSGEVTEGNQAVAENPKLINESAFDEGIDTLYIYKKNKNI